jgi:hypothetical protein
MAHPSSYYKDMADIDSQIAMVQFMQASNKTPTTVEEKNQQQLDILKAQKAGKQADLNKATAVQKGQQAINNFKIGTQRRAYDLNKTLANIPAPGGVGVPLFILAFLYMILFPVGGHTRMLWLFLVLFGHASIGAIGSRGNNSYWESGGQVSGSGTPTSSPSPGVTNISGPISSVPSLGSVTFTGTGNNTGGIIGTGTAGTPGNQLQSGSFTPGTNPFGQTLGVSANAIGNFTGTGTQQQPYAGNINNIIPFFGFNALEQING